MRVSRPVAVAVTLLTGSWSRSGYQEVHKGSGHWLCGELSVLHCKTAIDRQYGRQLTALVLGDKTGLQGQKIHVEGHKGVLVSIECEVGGK